jgi:hypothetical protein
MKPTITYAATNMDGSSVTVEWHARDKSFPGGAPSIWWSPTIHKRGFPGCPVSSKCYGDMLLCSNPYESTDDQFLRREGLIP